MKLSLFSAALAAVIALPIAPMTLLADEHAKAMTVTKTPGCGCCSAWADIAGAAGYDVDVIENDDYAATKQEHGVPDALRSCHSARVDGYVIEGHVPMAAIEKLLKERPDVTGISVPGMPAGSPGMGDDPTAQFDVIVFGGSAGSGAVYHRAGQ